MSKLVYITNTSLDGYVEDSNGAFDWVDPAGVFEAITELVRPIGTYLLGRRVYQIMEYWNAPIESYSPDERDFARVWQNTEKIVFSRTLNDITAPTARIERTFDPEMVRKLKQESTHDIAIGGAELAGLALNGGVLDECHLFVNPVIVGGGKPAFQTSSRRNLELMETRRFPTGTVYVRYRIAP